MVFKTIIHRKNNQPNDVDTLDKPFDACEVKLSESEEKLTREDIKVIKRLARDYERSIEYYNMKTHPRRTLWLGLIGGMARGLGFAIGFTLLALIFIYLLRGLVDVPVIGNFIAELLEYIEDVRGIPY